MKPNIFTVCLLLTAHTILAGTITGSVIRVTDGDTIVVLDADRTQHKIRLAGIDCPERKQAYGNKAKQALSAMVFSKTVKITYTEKDRYGRIIGDIYWGKHWINLEMVGAGWAWHYKHYSKDKRLADAEAAARAGHKGLWADPNPVAPWEYRRAPKSTQTPQKASEVTGGHWLNTSSGTRHNSGCKYFKNTKRGRIAGPSEGKACGECGG